MSEIVRVKGLKKTFQMKSGISFGRNVGLLKVINGVSFQIERGDIFSIVGESGCGKSTIAKILTSIESYDEGNVQILGKELKELKGEDLKSMKSKVQMIFQDPLSSLNPNAKVGYSLEEPLIIHRMGKKKERRERVLKMVENVGLQKEYLSRYPHEFSGGQCQRISIARALMTEPELLIGDEPLSALDASVQAQVINLLMSIKNKLNFTMILISHDLSVVKHMSDKIAVLYLGSVVEYGDAKEVTENPKHPYTKMLINSVPVPKRNSKLKKFDLDIEDIPSPLNLPVGCTFKTRCPIANPNCDILPEKVEINDRHVVYCSNLKEANKDAAKFTLDELPEKLKLRTDIYKGRAEGVT